MKLNRFELAGILAALILTVLSGVFFVTQGIAHADNDPCNLPGMTVFGCDEDNDEESNPCSLPGMAANPDCNGGNDGDSLAEQINCEIYAQLMAQGDPIPQGFDASGCSDDDDGDDDGGGDDEGDGDGGGGGGSTPVCSDGSDNDGDGKTDMSDPGCSDANDTDETDPSSGGSSGGGGGGGGGSVHGASTAPAQCAAYLTGFIKPGASNDKNQVIKLQVFLKVFEKAPVEISGTYDAPTIAAVHAFQTKHTAEVLTPWNITQSTGFVYLTTRKKINEVYCNYDFKFPLSAQENALIESAKKLPASVSGVQAPSKSAAPLITPEPSEPKKPVVQVTSTDTTETPRSSPWASITDFFRRLFNRGR